MDSQVREPRGRQRTAVAAQHLSPALTGPPLADDHLRRMLGLLAGRHRRLSRQRRIAIAAERHAGATGMRKFARGTGMDLLVATARLWRPLSHHDADGAFHIDGGTGPAEHSALANDDIPERTQPQPELDRGVILAR
jgi:hypothetical protein